MNRGVKGQASVFIIIGVLVVGAVVLFFLLRNSSKNPDLPAISEEMDVDYYLEVCMEDRVYETIEILLENGGYLDNEEKLKITYGFGDEDNQDIQDITYLCYTSEDYVPCVIQEGSIIRNMEKDIESELLEDMKDCLDELERGFKDEGYTVTRENPDEEEFKFDLIEDELLVEINSTFVLTKAEERIIHNDFELEFPTKIYNLGKVTERILEYETKYSSFDTLTYMNLYPDIKISTRKTLDSSDIYLIENRDTNEVFKFAVRGGVIPHA